MGCGQRSAKCQVTTSPAQPFRRSRAAKKPSTGWRAGRSGRRRPCGTAPPRTQGLARELGMLFEERSQDALVLLGLDRAGRVDEPAARATRVATLSSRARLPRGVASTSAGASRQRTSGLRASVPRPLQGASRRPSRRRRERRAQRVRGEDRDVVAPQRGAAGRECRAGVATPRRRSPASRARRGRPSAAPCLPARRRRRGRRPRWRRGARPSASPRPARRAPPPPPGREAALDPLERAGDGVSRASTPAAASRARASLTRGIERKYVGSGSRRERARAMASAGPRRWHQRSASQRGSEPAEVSQPRGSAIGSGAGGGPSRCSRRRTALAKPAERASAARASSTDSETAACSATRRYRSW